MPWSLCQAPPTLLLPTSPLSYSLHSCRHHPSQTQATHIYTSTCIHSTTLHIHDGTMHTLHGTIHTLRYYACTVRYYACLPPLQLPAEAPEAARRTVGRVKGSVGVAAAGCTGRGGPQWGWLDAGGGTHCARVSRLLVSPALTNSISQPSPGCMTHHLRPHLVTTAPTNSLSHHSPGCMLTYLHPIKLQCVCVCVCVCGGGAM